MTENDDPSSLLLLFVRGKNSHQNDEVGRDRSRSAQGSQPTAAKGGRRIFVARLLTVVGVVHSTVYFPSLPASSSSSSLVPFLVEVRRYNSEASLRGHER